MIERRSAEPVLAKSVAEFDRVDARSGSTLTEYLVTIFRKSAGNNHSNPTLGETKVSFAGTVDRVMPRARD